MTWPAGPTRAKPPRLTRPEGTVNVPRLSGPAGAHRTVRPRPQGMAPAGHPFVTCGPRREASAAVAAPPARHSGSFSNRCHPMRRLRLRGRPPADPQRRPPPSRGRDGVNARRPVIVPSHARLATRQGLPDVGYSRPAATAEAPPPPADETLSARSLPRGVPAGLVIFPLDPDPRREDIGGMRSHGRRDTPVERHCDARHINITAA